MGLPVIEFSNALAYYDSYRRERLPANLLQAQRDYFGAHTYQRIDKPLEQKFHSEWLDLRRHRKNSQMLTQKRQAQRRKGSRPMKENEISKVIIGAAIEVHQVLGGPGLLEDVYEEAAVHELQLRGLTVERQVPVPLEYKGKFLRKRLVLDLLVDRPRHR